MSYFGFRMGDLRRIKIWLACRTGFVFERTNVFARENGMLNSRKKEEMGRVEVPTIRDPKGP